MAFFSKKYNERANRIERYILKNKFFFITAFVLTIILACSALKNNNEQIPVDSETAVQEQEEETTSKELPKWRFYYTDAWILGIGGTICTINIIRERRKAKENL